MSNKKLFISMFLLYIPCNAMDVNNKKSYCIETLMMQSIESDVYSDETRTYEEQLLSACNKKSYGKLLKNAIECNKKETVFSILSALCNSPQLPTDLEHMLDTPKLQLYDYVVNNFLLLLARHKIKDDVAQKCIQHLAIRGIALDCANHQELTPIHQFAMYGRTELVKCLMEHGVKGTCTSQKKLITPLHLAGNASVAELLITNGGADLHVKDYQGNTPLHVAVTNIRGYEISRVLLKYGANINALNNNGDTPLHLAMSYKGSQIAECLIAHGANCFIQNKAKQTAVPIILGKTVSIRPIIQ